MLRERVGSRLKIGSGSMPRGRAARRHQLRASSCSQATPPGRRQQPSIASVLTATVSVRRHEFLAPCSAPSRSGGLAPSEAARSPSNASNDLVNKLRVYHQSHVDPYWVVDPQNETLTVLRWTPDGYLAALTAGRVDRVRAEPFEATELPVGVLFGDEE